MKGEIFLWVVDLSFGQFKGLTGLTRIGSRHIRIYSQFNNSEEEIYYFTSPHLNEIKETDFYRAFYRAKALLRILNGILLLNNRPQIVYDQQSIYFYDANGINRRRTHHLILQNMELEYEELENPFQETLSYQKDKRGKNDYITDVFDLACKESLVKEVIILFSLAHTDLLYILVNTFKIIENIKYDLKLSEQSTEDLSEDFQKAYFYFKKGPFGHYSNTRDGSGLFARHGAHGAAGNEYGKKKKKPLFKDINIYIRILIWEWINYKIEKNKGYRHNPLSKQMSNVEEMRDEDYDFDL